ncbi:MAG: MarR family winged helix-turn-helix transcriptional regulator [Ignavibacteriales bacterium]
MSKKLEGDRAIEQQVNKLTVAKCMDCACFNLRKTTRAITQLYDEALRPTDLRVTQFSLLIAIMMLGSVTVTRLAEVGVMDRTTLTRNLKPLEKKGLIKVVTGDDQRTRVVTLTTRGKEVLAKALPLWEKAQASVIKRLGQERWNSLQGDLGEMVSLASKS